MATYNTLTGLLTAIANAIRSKTGETGVINAQDFPSKISNIEVGTPKTYLLENGVYKNGLTGFNLINVSGNTSLKQNTDNISLSIPNNGVGYISSKNNLNNIINSGFTKLMFEISVTDRINSYSAFALCANENFSSSENWLNSIIFTNMSPFNKKLILGINIVNSQDNNYLGYYYSIYNANATTINIYNIWLE